MGGFQKPERQRPPAEGFTGNRQNYMGVSKNNGTPKSSVLIGFSIIFTIHFGVPLFLETSIYLTPFSKGH